MTANIASDTPAPVKGKPRCHTEGDPIQDLCVELTFCRCQRQPITKKYGKENRRVHEMINIFIA